jgi:glycosyltransferase involved in cell wall biosynthesis
MQPLVSIIVPTRNSAQFLDGCLKSIAGQTYPNTEIIVVDRDSTDDTKAIAGRYTKRVFNHGPERSAQVNFGVKQARGEYVYKVDSDFILDPHVVAQCVAKATEGYDASRGAQFPGHARSAGLPESANLSSICSNTISSTPALGLCARMFTRTSAAYAEGITAGEDYDFQNKLNRAGYRTGFIPAEALHLGEPKSFWRYLIKCYGYGKDAAHYQHDNPQEFNGQLQFILLVWLKHWRRFLRHPLRGLGLLIHYLFKFSFAGAGLLRGRSELRRRGGVWS